ASYLKSATIAHNLPVAPNNVGPKTIPNYDAVAAQAIKGLPGGGTVFVGQRDDPFFVDLGTTFDSIHFRTDTGAEGGGKDDLAGYSVHSIVLQVPEADVTKNGEPVASANASNAVVGVWASTERKKLQVSGSGEEGHGNWVQVSRLGNPLVNEVVIPLGQKDRFNRTVPADDAQYASFVLNPALAKLMNALFGLGVQETNRTDIVQAVLQGLPGLNQQTGKPVDTIKVNLGAPPARTPQGQLQGTLARPRLVHLLLPLGRFGVTTRAWPAGNHSPPPPRHESSAGGNSFAAPGRSTDERIRALQSPLRANPKKPDRLA